MMMCLAGICSVRAHKLRAARRICQKLQKAYLEDESAPLNMLKSCEAQLEQLECWLTGRVKKSVGSKEQVERKLALPRGLASQSAEARMKETFKLQDGEVLAQELHCAVKSVTFFHPGQLFITTERLCFHGSVAFLPAKFVLPWSGIARMRAVVQNLKDDDATKKGRSSDSGYPVRIVLKKAIAFDGVQVESLELNLFDPMDVAAMHRCTEILTGHGIFENIVATPNELGVPGEEEIHAHVGQHAPVEVVELERRSSVLREDWQAPFLPIDIKQAPAKWTHADHQKRKYSAHPLLPEDVPEHGDAEGPPISTIVVMGRRRKCNWNAVVDDQTDADGWQYGLWRFGTEPAGWEKERGIMSHVRRRTWNPVFLDSSDSKSGRITASIMSLRKLKGTELVQTEVGNVPLETLGEWLQADDWLAPRTFMAEYFKDLQAKEVEVDMWEDPEAKSEQVSGKLRNLRMKVPVPPQPMCPKETRAHQAFHVCVEADRVFFETSTVSLDVPYGTSFKVVICNTFTIDPETQTTRMVSSFALNWVQSTMMKGMIEANVPGELVKEGHRVAAFVKRFNQQKLEGEDFGTTDGNGSVNHSEELVQPRKADLSIPPPSLSSFPFQSCCAVTTEPSFKFQ